MAAPGNASGNGATPPPAKERRRGGRGFGSPSSPSPSPSANDGGGDPRAAAAAKISAARRLARKLSEDKAAAVGAARLAAEAAMDEGEVRSLARNGHSRSNTNVLPAVPKAEDASHEVVRVAAAAQAAGDLAAGWKTLAVAFAADSTPGYLSGVGSEHCVIAHTHSCGSWVSGNSVSVLRTHAYPHVAPSNVRGPSKQPEAFLLCQVGRLRANMEAASAEAAREAAAADAAARAARKGDLAAATLVELERLKVGPMTPQCPGP